VHDIGKNIVKVVLQCNHYEVIDLGVMVDGATILQEARAHKVDMIGLSGLITPSLEQMALLAQEMQRQGWSMPLLIGGATTSPLHTAVKIAPHYDGVVVQVKDASQAVGVVARLLNDREGYGTEIRAQQARLRQNYAARQSRGRSVPLTQARGQRLSIDWSHTLPPAPRRLGVQPISPELRLLLPFIDWTPFFHTWEIAGRYPEVLSDPQSGEAASKLFQDAQQWLEQICRENLLQAKGVFALYPANAVTDDLELYGDAGQVIARIHTLRQQAERSGGQPFLALADFVAPHGWSDHLGLFAVTCGVGLDGAVAVREQAGDDYGAIMLKALADRLTEAFAEWLHQHIRREAWGYAVAESLSSEALIREAYQGIRPAPGYPACPDHTEKETIFALLEVTRHTGMRLTESGAMTPQSAICGYYFAHPQSRYFRVDHLGRDQVAEYAQRKNMSIDQVERWLAPVLGYEPDGD
jgi:5-methyltetrahydrofolate--homocysteine methyltransferase